MIGLELRSGTRGVFKVQLDRETVFDRADTRRMPEPGELVGLLRGRLGDPRAWRHGDRQARRG